MWFTPDRIRAIYRNDPSTHDVLAEIVQKRIAWPWLCDQLGHINNARYFDLLQDGRVEWMIQNGLVRPMLRRRMSFLVAGVGGVYRHAIPRMAPFTLTTRLCTFDQRWLYFEQSFGMTEAGVHKTAARFLMRVMLRTPKAARTPRECLQKLGAKLPEHDPTPPPDLESWSGAQQACLQQMQ